MPTDLIVSDKNASLLNAEESVGSKLLREACVFGGGTVLGIGSGIADKVTNPMHTAGEGAVAYGLGLGLGVLQRRVPGMKIIGAGLTYAFLKDIALRGESLSGIWSDNWNSSNNFDTNLQGVKNTLGKFIVDTTFASVCGGLGAKRGAGIGQRADIYNDLQSRGFDNSSVGTIRVVTGEPGISHGTAFAIDERRLVTAAHVLGESRYCASLYVPNVKGEKALKVLAIDPKTDLAIVETATPHGMTPMKLARTLPSAETPVMALGSLRNGSGFRTFLPSGGAFKGEVTGEAALSARLAEMTTMEKLGGELRLRLIRLLTSPVPGDGSQVSTFATVPLRAGMSGGPLINPNTFEVIGVNSFSVHNAISGFGNVKELRALMSASNITLIPKSGG
ncbi:MAG: serine protease [Candidatus Obscuribacterales bacterium]|nr:serine protease [Candidatus Obscuribacterales bacterium]